ncbi:MAG: glycosyltransferase family 39 protein, partial [Candidatus Omnitrophica bacterium]|nr:glycosyltransferase family 39 protein [Candidatus Omnitrophota bacterium]
FILNGRLPYTGFFTHHNPMAYFVSAVAVLFSGPSFVKFRLVFGVFYLLGFISLFFYVRKNWFKQEIIIITWLITFLTISATYTWGHMVLGDTLSAYFLLPSYLILVFIALRGTKVRWEKVLVVSILAALAVLTSSAVVITVLIIYAFLFFLFVSQCKLRFRDILLFITIVITPYIIFFLYLVFSGSLNEFYRQAIRYTSDIYVQLPGGFTSRNPFRISIIYFNEFLKNYRSIVLMIKDLNLANPFAPALALSSLVFIVYLILNRKFSLSVFVFLMLVYASLRGNPYTTSETDYQAIQYHFFSMFNGLAAIVYLWNSLSLNSNREIPKKIIEGFMFVLLSVFMFFLFWLFFDKWWEKTYLKYMGQQALIYDRPPIAAILNDLIPKNEYYFIAPFDFEDQLYMKSKPASKYIVVLPGMDHLTYFQEEIIADLSDANPRIIVFNTDYRFFNSSTPHGLLVLDYINNKYTTINSLGLKKNGYTLKYEWMGNFNFERHFFILKEKQDEIINEMISKGYLIPPS